MKKITFCLILSQYRFLKPQFSNGPIDWGLSNTLFVNTFKVMNPEDLFYPGCKIFGIKAASYEEWN